MKKRLVAGEWFDKRKKITYNKDTKRGERMKKLSTRKKKWIERTVANDRSSKVILYNRFFIFALAVLLQLIGYAVLLVALVYNSKLALGLQILVFALEIVFVLVILNQNDRPSSKMSWLLVVMIAPVFGVPMYLFNGRGRPARKLRRKINAAREQNGKQIKEILGETPLVPSQNRNDAICRYLAKYGDYPVFYDGEVEYYKSGEEAFPVMIEALKKAEKFILVEYFIIAHGYMWNEILKILLEKAEAGVQVRVLYDDFGCMMTLPPKYERYLESLSPNLKCMTFNNVVPFFALRMNNRDHRKILVIDGKTAFTGGFNFADEYIAKKERFGYWKDTGVKVTGNAVQSFTRIFFEMWNAFREDKEDLREYLLPYEKTEATANTTPFRMQPYADSPLDQLSIGESVYVDIINRAHKYVWIFTPYLILDDYVRGALCDAAMRGVDVRIVTPGIPDKKLTYRLTRANYQVLMRAGVKIYEYTPGFIHAKNMLCDDECAVVGTINLDYRSLYHHFENALYFAGCEAIADVKRDCEEVFAVSKPCSAEYPKRSFFGRVLDAVLRVLETLM